MIAIGILSIVLPLLPCLLLVWLLWPKENAFRPPFLLKLVLATGLALGFSSIAMLLYLPMAGSLRPSFFLWETALTAITTTILVWRLSVRKSATDNPFLFPSEPRPLFLAALSVTFYLILALAIVNFLLWRMNHPHGGEDALNNWNLRATFLFRGGENWRNVLSPMLSSSDCPMLIPCSVARVWHYAGQETLWGPAAAALFFTFGTLVLLSTTLAFLRGEQCALLAGMCLLGTGFVLRHGAYQQADVPLGFFLLATFVLLHLADQPGHAGACGLFVLSGLSAGFVAWTKNEGLLLVLLLGLARMITGIRSGGWKPYSKEAFYFGAGFLPILAFVLYHKMVLAPEYPMFAALDFHSLLGRIFDPLRYLQIAKTSVKDLVAFSRGAPVLLLFALLLCGIRVEPSDKRGIRTFATFALLAGLGCIVSSLVLPVDSRGSLVWWLDRSVSRLLLQLWPTLLFICFLMMNLPRKQRDAVATDAPPQGSNPP